jgi:S1-C subfamily serine protease
MTTSNGSSPLVELSDVMANAVEQAARATVTVNGRQRYGATGIVIAPDMVLTAEHVVERDEDITIVTADGTQHAAQIAGRDAATDVAVLRIPGASLEAATPASKPARVGQLVLAVGRPSDSGPQASLGIVGAVVAPWRSPRGGVIERIVRTDAIPYPGFSGGPLVAIDGSIVGMLTTGLANGPALAIPTDIAMNLAQTLAQHGQLKRGYLGISSQPVRLPNNTPLVQGKQPEIGLLLVQVEQNSPAAAAGLYIGDILVSMGGQVIADVDDLQAQLAGDKVGQTVPVELLRGGQLHTLQVTIGTRG